MRLFHITERIAAKALFSSNTVSVAAGASGVTYTVASPPPGKRWFIAAASINTATGVSVAALRVDGTTTGQAVGSGSTGHRLFKDFFGDYLISTDTIEVVASNTGTAAANATIVLYGWTDA